MNESFNQSMSIKRVSRKIRKIKTKYMNFTIFLLIINFIAFIIQKNPEFKKPFDNKIFTKNIFLLLEDLGLKALIIISFFKSSRNSVILCSLIYFIIAIIMIYYIILNQFSSLISENQKINEISIVMFILNIILYSLEGVMMVLCAQLMRKEEREKMKEKYGFKTGNDVQRSKNILEENSFGY